MHSMNARSSTMVLLAGTAISLEENERELARMFR